eukprot:380358-Pyramimonas_sp.AAC.1
MRPPHPILHFRPHSTALRGPIESPTETPSGTARMPHPHPTWHCHPPSTALRGPMGSSTEAPSGTARM